MKSSLTAIMAAILLTASVGVVAAAKKPEEITVAYFLEWPTANQVAQVNETYDKEMGLKVKWRAFGNGNEMSAAMASGDVQIAYSQGLVPYVVAVSKGLPLQLVGVAVSYAENDNCVVHKDAGITKANAKSLEGKKVATPIGNVTHYKLLRSLEHLGVDAKKVNILPMNPADGAAAMARGDVAMACGFGGALSRMKEYGSVLLTATEQEAIGIRVFDIISVTKDFANDHPDLVVKFLQVTEDANKVYAKDPGSVQPTIAKAAGMKLADSNGLLAKFAFPTAKEQLSAAWMGGTVQDFTKGVADFFVAQGELPKALDDYGPYIDTSFMKKVK